MEISESWSEIECDLCERKMKRYYFIEADCLFVCLECYQERYEC